MVLSFFLFCKSLLGKTITGDELFWNSFKAPASLSCFVSVDTEVKCPSRRQVLLRHTGGDLGSCNRLLFCSVFFSWFISLLDFILIMLYRNLFDILVAFESVDQWIRVAF